MALRAEFAIRHAFNGFSIDWEQALELVRTEEISLSEEEKKRRDILVAAIDNLVDFAVAEEFQLSEAVHEEMENEEESEEDRHDMFIAFCEKYNDRYAYVENLDIEYALMIADALVIIPDNVSLMYMTQGDERVRPWHLQFEGFTAPKSRFPAWLIPPIEHQCRCYLVEVDGGLSGVSDSALASSKSMEIPEWFNPTFKESVALGGRIFSDEHPYFSIPEEKIGWLRGVALKIKEGYLNA